MSWSVTFIGRPEKVVEALGSYSSKLTDQSKAEYDEALPHLQGLIAQSVGNEKLIQVAASGHANFDKDGKKTYGAINVKIDEVYSQLIV